MRNALSIDLEEWFCVSNFEHVIRREEWPALESRVEEQTRSILELLDRRQVRATFFLLGWVAERHPELIREVADRGHEIACHGYWHRLVYDLRPEEFRRDLERSLDVIGGLTGAACRGYRAPSFSLRRDMDWAWRILAELGFEYDSSVFPVRHPRYGAPDAPRAPFVQRGGDAELIEIPLSTAALLGHNLAVAGGGYFRLYPLAVTRWAIRRLNREGLPAIIYLHPWEVDPGQPKPAVSRLTLARHRVGMAKVLDRLDALLGEFEFTAMEEIVAEARRRLEPAAPPAAGAGG